MNVIVVEDEKKLNQMICDYLEAMGHKCFQEYDGLSALHSIPAQNADFIILDIMLPGLDGLDLLRRIREFSRIPVIMLTAKSGEENVIMALDLGADDFINKPFSMKELEARIRAVSRRVFPHPQDSEFSCGPFSVDEQKRSVKKEGRNLELTAVQFEILVTLLRNPGRVFTRMQLLKSFQDDVYEGYERTIDVHIKNIRKIMEKTPSEPEYILTVRGVGYKFFEGEG